MRVRTSIGMWVVLLVTSCWSALAIADDDPAPEPAPAAEEARPEEPKPDEAKPDDPDHAAAAGATPDSDGDGIPDADDASATDVDGDGTPDAEEEFDEEDPPTDPFDADGDGQVEPDEIEAKNEFIAAFKDVPDQPLDEAEVQKRPAAQELEPSLTLEKFRELVRIAKKVVLEKMMAKIEKKSAKKMETFSFLVFGFSACGLLLLLMPLVLAKKYPGKAGLLFKYSSLAALTFVVTVNLFGGVIYGFRAAQGALGNYTNPSVAIASGTFDSLDNDAEYFITTGRELFGPSLEMMRKYPERQPAELILENGLKVVKDARVFLSIKNMFAKVDWVFGIIPIVLTLVTLILFVLAIRPTLTAIIKLPAAAASGAGGGAGRDVIRASVRRVIGEMKATACTVGVLVVLTLVSSFVLGKTVQPALRSFLEYFGRSVTYLAFSEGASSGLVFVALFGVILFLVLNLAALILSMALFLGKTQKIFQQRFNEGTPVARHVRFFQWGTPSVLLVQLFPLVFAYLALQLLEAVNGGLFDGAARAEDVPWTRFMLTGPLVLVGAFLVLFWAVRGVKAIKFLAGYKVKLPEQPKI